MARSGGNTEEREMRINLVRAGVRPIELARRLGVSPNAISNVLRGRSRSARIESILRDPAKLARAAGKLRISGVRKHMLKVEDVSKKILPLLKQYGVRRAGLFGSVARGEARPESDVDLLVELPETSSLLDLAGLQIDLETILGKKVDVITYNSIYHLLRERILGEEARIL